MAGPLPRATIATQGRAGAAQRGPLRGRLAGRLRGSVAGASGAGTPTPGKRRRFEARDDGPPPQPRDAPRRPREAPGRRPRPDRTPGRRRFAGDGNKYGGGARVEQTQPEGPQRERRRRASLRAEAAESAAGAPTIRTRSNPTRLRGGPYNDPHAGAIGRGRGEFMRKTVLLRNRYGHVWTAKKVCISSNDRTFTAAHAPISFRKSARSFTHKFDERAPDSPGRENDCGRDLLSYRITSRQRIRVDPS